MSKLLDKSYWNNTGRHQKLYNSLHKLIPASGSVEDNEELELVRVVSNIYYDLYNNGLCNIETRLPEVRGMMDLFKKVLIEKMGVEQFDLVYRCWVLIESWDYSSSEWDSDGYFPEWDNETGWFSERLMLAFETLLDAAIEICAEAYARKFDNH